jgi:hypothetical protein
VAARFDALRDDRVHAGLLRGKRLVERADLPEDERACIFGPVSPRRA